MIFYSLHLYVTHFMSSQLLLLLISLSPISPTSSSFSTTSIHYGAPVKISGLDQTSYIRDGDISIGAFLFTTPSSGSTSCSDRAFSGSFAIESTEAIAFAVKLVNESPWLLPNVTLGFITINTCGKSKVALAKALSFLQRVPQQPECSCDTPIVESTSANSSQCPHIEMPFYDAVAVLAPASSQASSLVSNLFTSAQIPMVGTRSTSDELSDKQVHPYYVRVIAPDQYQVHAMLNFLQDNRWSYTSVVYSQGSYGESAFSNIGNLAPQYGICIATSHKIASHTDFDLVVKDLLAHPRARLVILFTYSTVVKAILLSVRRFNATGQFIWLGSDGWASSFRSIFSGFEDDILGAFSVDYQSKVVPDLYYYIRDIQVNGTVNPWFKSAWESLVDCSSDDDTGCYRGQNILVSSNFAFISQTSLYMDAVLAIAHAVHNLMSNLCPNATGPQARQCIQGSLLLDYLRNVSFHGFNGFISFNENGDMEGKYDIRQIVLDYRHITFLNLNSSLGLEARTVATYDISSKTVNYTDREIVWDHLDRKERIVPLTADHPHPDVPESVCSGPCRPGQFRIQKELVCCWECRSCRDNEKLVENNTSCQVCPIFTWPDPASNFTSCRPIPLTYPLITQGVPLLQICLGFAALICTCLVVMAYLYFRDTRVIKAASRELSVLQMMAIFVGYATVILFQAPPTHATCGALYFLFCLSFAWLYSPLLVKTVRIYRIFLSGVKHNGRPRFISPQAQLIMTAALIVVQVVLCGFTYAVYQPTARKFQPVRTEKYVELACDMTLPGLTSFLTYNLLLISLCSYFAFKTRKLPDNFNESKFITMCVSTTLVIWLAFIPTYFTSRQTSIKVMLLSLALLLNHTVALIFLFTPKIYAAVYVDPDNVMPTRFHTGTRTAFIARATVSNRVAPSPNSTNDRD